MPHTPWRPKASPRSGIEQQVFVPTQKEKSLIERLPVGVRDAFMRQLSTLATGPGGRAPRSAASWDVARKQVFPWRRHAANLGVIPIEVVKTGALTAAISVSVPVAYRANMIVDVGPDATPAQLTFVGTVPQVNDAPQTVTFAAPGAKTATVAPAVTGFLGKAAWQQ